MNIVSNPLKNYRLSCICIGSKATPAVPPVPDASPGFPEGYTEGKAAAPLSAAKEATLRGAPEVSADNGGTALRALYCVLA